jgi:hypothetical protein
VSQSSSNIIIFLCMMFFDFGGTKAKKEHESRETGFEHNKRGLKGQGRMVVIILRILSP